MFLGPLMGVGRINADFMSAESQYPNLKTLAARGTFKSATWWIFLLVCCLSFYAGLRLVKSRNILVVKHAKIILWLIGPVANIVYRAGYIYPFLNARNEWTRFKIRRKHVRFYYQGSNLDCLSFQIKTYWVKVMWEKGQAYIC